MLNKVRFWAAKLSGRIGGKPSIKGIIRFIRYHMKTLIAVLFAFALGFFELGFQLYFQVDKISTHVFTGLEIFSFIFFVCGLLLSITLIKSERRDKDLTVLKPHFKDMLQSYGVIPNLNLKENYGQIAENILHKFPNEFVAHFPEQATKWDGYCADIKTHNEKYTNFQMKIKQFFESQGLEVRPDNDVSQLPCIYEAIFHPLFIWWRDRLIHKACPLIDFTRIEADSTHIDNPIHSPSNLHVFDWPNETIAYVGSEADKKKCKEVITLVALDIEYEKEATNLINSVSGLVKSVFDLKSQLTNIIQNIDKNWPIAGTNWGTKEYQFRRLTECPICRRLPK